jgi:hypothetical protein
MITHTSLAEFIQDVRSKVPPKVGASMRVVMHYFEFPHQQHRSYKIARDIFALAMLADLGIPGLQFLIDQGCDIRHTDALRLAVWNYSRTPTGISMVKFILDQPGVHILQSPVILGQAFYFDNEPLWELLLGGDQKYIKHAMEQIAAPIDKFFDIADASAHYRLPDPMDRKTDLLTSLQSNMFIREGGVAFLMRPEVASLLKINPESAQMKPLWEMPQFIFEGQ